MKTLLPVLFVLLISPSVASAQNGFRAMPAADDRTPAPSATPFKTKAMLEAEALKARNQARVEMCEKVTAQVNFRLNQYEAVKDKYSQRYHGIATKAKSSLENLKSQVCNTTTVEADLKTYEEKIANFTAAFRDFQTQFGKGRELACTEDKGAKGQMVTSRQRLTLVRNRATELHQFVKTRLHPNLKDAITACKASKGTDNEN